MSIEIGELKAKLIADANQLKAGIQTARKEFHNLGKEAKDTSKEMDTLNKSAGHLGSILSALGSAAALGGLTNVFKQVVNESQKLTNSMIGLSSMAKAFGVDVAGATEATKKLAEDGLAPVSTYATSLKNLLSTGIGLDRAVELINVFKDRAAFGRSETISFDQAVQNLSETFKTESSELGDLSGMTENYSLILSKGLKVLQDRGETLAKNVDQLTEAERAEAKYLGILDVSQPYLGDAIKLTETFSGKQAALNAKWVEAKQNLGEALIPELDRLMDIVTPIVDEFVIWTDKNQGVISGMAASATTALTLTTALTGLTAAFTILRSAMGVWGAIATAAGIAGAAILAYKEGSDSVADSIARMESQNRDSFISMANDAETLEGRMKTLKEGTDEYNAANTALTRIYDDILSANPEIKKGFEEHGQSLQWLQGEIRNTTAEFIAMQKAALGSKQAAIDSQITLLQETVASNRKQLEALEKAGLNVHDPNTYGNVSPYVAKQAQRLYGQSQDLASEVSRLFAERKKLQSDFEALLEPVDFNAVIDKYTKTSSPEGDGNGKGKGTTNKADHATLFMSNIHFKERGAAI